MTAVLFVKKSLALCRDPKNLKSVPGDDDFSGSEEYYTPPTTPQPFDQLSLKSLALNSPLLFNDHTLRKIRATYQPKTAGIPRTSDPSTETNIITASSPVSSMIPEWDSEFFTKFGNKVRLGTSGVVNFSQTRSE